MSVQNRPLVSAFQNRDRIRGQVQVDLLTTADRNRIKGQESDEGADANSRFLLQERPLNRATCCRVGRSGSRGGSTRKPVIHRRPAPVTCARNASHVSGATLDMPAFESRFAGPTWRDWGFMRIIRVLQSVASFISAIFSLTGGLVVW